MKKYMGLALVLALMMGIVGLVMAEAVDAVPMTPDPLVVEQVILQEAPMPRINLTPIFEALIGVIALLIYYKLVPWLKVKLSAEQYQKMLAFVKTAVFAAEKIYAGPGNGKEKLMHVKAALAKHGYEVDVDAIEAMVYELDLEKLKAGSLVVAVADEVKTADAVG